METVIEKFRDLLGLHVCNWTTWVPFEVVSLRAPTWEEMAYGGCVGKMLKETHRWQRRKCEACGFVQERKL